MLLQVPGQGKHDIERTVQSISVEPGHEQFVDDYNANTSSFQRLLAKFKSDENLPACYWNHPVVQGALAGVLVFPIALYLDGVPYSITDSVIGFWLVSLIDSRRYLIGLLRKRNLCKCGCKGWCTFWHFFAMLHWDLKAGAEGRYPDARYDGPWLAGSDDARKERSSHIFPFKLACLYIKGDWMELGTTIGLPTWQDALRPCFCCNAFFGNFFATSGMTMEALTWLVNADDDYFAAASRCELEVPIRCMLDVQMLLASLRYDKRKTGARGRALVRDLVVGGVSLCAKDRLEPCAALPDVGQLDDLDTFPTIVIFWRASAETLTRHRNPIFDPELGITPKRSLVVDVLHDFFLGILLVWCRVTIWRLISSGAYGHTGTDDSFVAVVMVIRSRLMRFYSTYEAQHKDEKLTRVADLVPSMIGEANDQKLKTKGAETWGVCLFLISELESKHAAIGIDGTRLLHAGHLLEQIVRSWKAYDWTVPPCSAKDLAT